MKSLSDASFFRVFDLIIAGSNPGLKKSHWTIDDVSARRERHSFSGRSYGFAIEVFTLYRSDRCGWKLLVAKEYWWKDDHDGAFRTIRWARLIAGSRPDAMAWFRAAESSLIGRRDEPAPIDLSGKHH